MRILHRPERYTAHVHRLRARGTLVLGAGGLAGARPKRRLAQRVSWVQPLPDLLASALVSLLVQTGPTRRSPDGPTAPLSHS